MNAPAKLPLPQDIEDRLASVMSDAQLEARLESTLRTILKRAGGAAMMTAVDKAIQRVVRGKSGSLGDGWIA